MVLLLISIKPIKQKNIQMKFKYKPFYPSMEEHYEVFCMARVTNQSAIF